MAYLTKDSPIPEKGKGSKPSNKMLLFVSEYMVDLNANKAVLRAGYKSTNPKRRAAELLRHPLVQKEIEARMKDRQDRLELSAEYVINKLVDIVEQQEKGNPNAALRGLELLGKHLGLYKEKTEISGPDGEAIQYQKVQEDAADFTSAIARLAEREGKTGVAEVPNTGTAG